MKQTAEIITPWTGTGIDEDSNRPQLGDDYALDKWTDVTGQPSGNLHPDPNTYILKVVAEDTVISAIAGDSTYLINWVEDVPSEDEVVDPMIAGEGNGKDDEYDANAFGLLRAYLAQNGFSQAWIQQYTDNSLTRGENADRLVEGMKELPHS